jgi:hypothetical protein
MTGRLARLTVLTAFLISTGTHTALLQAFAWAKMTISFAQRDGLAAALDETFGGEHPCAVCVVLSKADAAPHSMTAAPAHSRVGHAAPTAAPRAVRVDSSFAVFVEPSRAFVRAFPVDSPPPKPVLS